MTPKLDMTGWVLLATPLSGPIFVKGSLMMVVNPNWKPGEPHVYIDDRSVKNDAAQL